MKRYSKPIPEIDNFLARNPIQDKDLNLENVSYNGKKLKKYNKINKIENNNTPTLDLHNLTTIDAEIKISNFINKALQQNLSKIVIVHGKGLHSDGGIGVLRNLVFKMLKKNFKSVVRNFNYMPDRDGGDGATEVFFD